MKRLRLAAALTQEALAERAGISAKAVSDLERQPTRLPRLESVSLLADALHLDAEQRAGLVAAARPPRSSAVAPAEHGQRRHSLPRPLTPLVGRAFDVATIEALVRGGEARLLTLIGPGGVGKTRLAIAVAGRVADGLADGAVLIDLTPLNDPALVIPAIARQLGLREDDPTPLARRLAEYLEPRRLLLVLDNFEHVIAARTAILDLLTACPRLVALVTSREALRLSGEHVFAVAPLALPEPATSPASLIFAPAVELFVQRARAAGAPLASDDPNLPSVAEICRRLDGLPLAVELAAAWTPLLAPATLLRRLETRLPLLVGGPYDSPQRQRTMREAIAWSYDLLDARQQRLFRALCVFEGGCTVEAAAAVAEEDATAMLRGLAELAAKSLVRLTTPPARQPAGEEPRVAILATIREYGLEQLAAAREADLLQRRHLAYFLALAGRAEGELAGPEQASWLRELEDDHDNLRAALRWALETGETAAARRLTAAMWPFWSLRGYLSEGRRWLGAALTAEPPAPDDAAADALRATLLLGATTLAIDQGDLAEAAELSDRGLTHARARGAAGELIAALDARGRLERERGHYREAEQAHQEALSLANAAGDQAGAALALAGLGTVASLSGDLPRATAFFDQSLTRFRELGNVRRIAEIQGDLARQLHLLGDLERAIALMEEALPVFQALGDTSGVANVLFAVGVVAASRGQYDQGEDLLRQSVVIWRERGDERHVAQALAGLGSVAIHREDHAAAGALLEKALAIARRFDDAWALGIHLTLLAIAELGDGRPRRARERLAEAIHLFRAIGNP
ncbi:MAG TPA: tetratricopeptide repeat protein, partial [Nitrolancea sp.]|nr:tetratricopeptide repeat protein [Nitrolancea sp.]